MELPPIITPPPVPVPPKIDSKKFNKSTIILFMAWVPVAGYTLMTLPAIFSNGFLDVFSVFFSYQIFFLIPSLVVIFTKNETAYKIARIFLIVEYVLVVGIAILIFIIFGGMQW